MNAAYDRAAAHAWAILARLAEQGTRGRYRMSFRLAEATHSWSALLENGTAETSDDAIRPDVLLAFDVDDYLACAAGTRTLHQSVFEGRTHVRGDRQLAMRFAQAFAQAAPAARIADSPAAALARRPCNPRRSEELSARLPRVSEVLRLERPTVERFREFVATGTPIILKNALEDWDLERLAPSRLKAEFGDLLGIVRPRRVDSGAAPHEDVTIQAFADLLDSLDSSARYLAYNEIPSALTEVVRHPPYFPRKDYDDPPNIWLGPAGTVTHLHRDGSDNLFAQIWGSKRFILYPPHARPFLYAWAVAADTGLDGCDVDPEQPDFDRFPLFREAAAIECVVEAGELFYLPEGWFHHVRSLAPSLSINFWTRIRR
jgi:hypothetical protein